MTREEALRRLRQLHVEIDRRVERLVLRHGRRLRCGRGCASCCEDGILVHEVEADRIRAGHPTLLATGVPHPEGACAFLDASGACRIYADRPYVCRTQGLPLRWYDLADDGETVVELRDLCPLNEEGGPPLEELPDEDCWQLGPFEEGLRRLQEAVDGGEGRRVVLRDLFTGT